MIKYITNTVKTRTVLCFFVLIFIGINSLAFSQENLLRNPDSSSDRATGFEEFRRGVQAFYRGTYNDAILLFEKALSYVPEEPLILDWLGKAYYQSGVEGSALLQWEEAASSGYGGILLKNKMEVIKERRSFYPDFPDTMKFVESASIPSETNEKVDYFKKPVSITTLPDGTFWVVSYGTNEIIHFDVNGIIISKTKGPLQGFSRPFDIYRTNEGNLLVSEFAADRISLLDKEGKFIKYFGSHGRDNGQLVGPQFLATDDYNNIFVTDFGNARIVVFSPDGEPLFTFGYRDALCPGFIAPTGIAIIDGLVYVADSVKGCIYTFDTAGNYIQALLPEGSLKQIESMCVWKNNLLVSTVNKVHFIDIALATAHPIASLGKAPSRITSAVPDANGNILLVDYKNEKIQIVSRIDELAGGIFVTLDKVYADKFPQMTIELKAQNRNGQPLVGLDHRNFFVTENNRLVNNVNLAGGAYLNTSCDITLLLDRSPASAKEVELVKFAVTEIAKAMKGRGKISIVSASEIPISEGTFTPEYLMNNSLKLKGDSSRLWNFDLGLRLAVSGLINAEPKRAVIFISVDDTIDANSFAQYSLNDLAAYMANNDVRFYAINLKQAKLPDEIRYLCTKTGGKSSYVYAEKGLEPLIDDIITAPIGRYQITYTSSLSKDFGQAFLPVEVEVRLLNRSGRDETAYFAPLD